MLGQLSRGQLYRLQLRLDDMRARLRQFGSGERAGGTRIRARERDVLVYACMVVVLR